MDAKSTKKPISTTKVARGEAAVQGSSSGSCSSSGSGSSSGRAASADAGGIESMMTEKERQSLAATSDSKLRELRRRLFTCRSWARLHRKRLKLEERLCKQLTKQLSDTNQTSTLESKQDVLDGFKRK